MKPHTLKGDCNYIHRHISIILIFRPTMKWDLLNSEFMYYSSVLKVVAPAVSSDLERQKILPWVQKLFRPEYQTSPLREKRNK